MSLVSASLLHLLPFGTPGECRSKVAELQAELDKAKAELAALRAFPDCQRVSYALGCDDVPPAGTAGFAPGEKVTDSASEPYDQNFKKIKIRAEYGRPVAAISCPMLSRAGPSWLMWP